MDSTYTETELDDLEKNVLRCFKDNRALNFLDVLRHYREIISPNLDGTECFCNGFETVEIHIAIDFLLDKFFLYFSYDGCAAHTLDYYVITLKGENALR